MRRRSFLCAVGILACLVCGVLGVLIALVRYEPPWYVNAGVAPGNERRQLSNTCLASCTQLRELIKNEPKWDGAFTAREINAFFEEGLYELKLDADLLRGKISEPRLAFEPGRIRLGFRYGKGIWSTIISMTLKVWVPQEDCSAVVLELENFQAGSLPVSAQSVLKEVSRLLGEKDILELNWYRHNGHLVSVLRFQTNQQRSNIQLTAIQVEDGQLMIQGRTNDPSLGPFVPAVPAPTMPSPAGHE